MLTKRGTQNNAPKIKILKYKKSLEELWFKAIKDLYISFTYYL